MTGYRHCPARRWRHSGATGDWLIAVEGRKSPGFFQVLERVPTDSIMISLTWTARTRVWILPPQGDPAAQLPVILAIAQRRTC